MTRTERITRKIQKLEAQLEYLKSELENAKLSDAEEAEQFQRIPARVRNRFDDMDELKRFVYGQHDGKGICGVTQMYYEKARSPYERLRCLRGVGDSTAKEALKALSIKSKNDAE